tara:strand:+ start:775 stop:1020 length:246 start_codon:yes stop_codon:yes gene_type:complete
VIKETIIYKRYRYLSVRVLKDTTRDDCYDVVFTSAAWPTFRKRYKNTDSYVMKELVMIYSIRASVLQWLPPRLTHWLVIGK